MGRALFSTKYAPAVAVQEPEPVTYEKWSIWNPFDPESEEFNRNAQREVFIDTEAYRRDQEAAATGAEISPSSETNDSDRSSPMAVGPDDPALLIADYTYDWFSGNPAEWTHRRGKLISQNRHWQSHFHNAFHPGSVDGEQTRPLRIGRPRSATASSGVGFLPPSSLRNSTTATEIDAEATISVSPRSPRIRRTVNITPISIPNEPSPSPTSPASPTTPTDNLYAREMQSLLTPSPPPSVTPHVYSWHRLALAVPPSPSPAAPAPTIGLMPNAGARMSLARINIATPRIRIQNAAI
ncbi:hypothetical protein H0H81_006567 [Sphagnurus paluster]|uniref:Uncharacterized protein n=1 Tax=Sphagnurus paluster TaxID=117069 RepID=A0A9P7GRQ9_9AGAR|nr:hypothetical protein H0H81_006567 [Sphagnurus paluster]